ncbi:hypothetical protein [Streptomyces luteogriseus]|uniref:hypothetical protein n=1 Tax=Streptomyces luteogriseus TaxID=68233 RepID=UPI0038102112
MKDNKRRKARMDHRTRERLPALPAVARAASSCLNEAKARLQALMDTPPGDHFTFAGDTFARAAKDGTTWAVNMATGRRIDLALAESRAFWAWAMVEFLQHTGVRIEEMLEASHHSLIQYRLPTTGEIVPLLQIAPSKTDEERVILVSPELADVLSAIIARIRDPRTGAVPYVSSYDMAEKTWNPQMPLLFQWRRSGESSRLSPKFLREALQEVLASTDLTDSAGQPLDFSPHDFRRIFITDAIRTAFPLTSRRSSPGTPTSTRPWGTTPSTPARRSRRIARSSRGAERCVPARSTEPQPTRSGTPSSGISSDANCPSGSALAHSALHASTNTLVFDAPCSDRIRLRDTASSRFATT